MEKNKIDILESLDLVNNSEFSEELVEKNINHDSSDDITTELFQMELVEDNLIDWVQNNWTQDLSDPLENISDKEEKINESNIKKVLKWIIFFMKYTFTSSIIFVLLIFITNYSAYIEIAKSYFNSEELKRVEDNMYSSMESANINEDSKAKQEQGKIPKEIEDNISEEVKISKNKTFHSMSKLVFQSKNEEINLNIDIAPYEDRIVIPKIWKNIPLLEIDRKIESEKKLDNIILDNLSNWVIRYPGTAKPGDIWNSYILGHSSNFPWINWEYNDVFALIDNVDYNDEIIVYYKQRKYVYKVKEKTVIKAGKVWTLKDRDTWKAEITLVTCWPVGTTLNRLVVIWELVEEK